MFLRNIIEESCIHIAEKGNFFNVNFCYVFIHSQSLNVHLIAKISKAIEFAIEFQMEFIIFCLLTKSIFGKKLNHRCLKST